MDNKIQICPNHSEYKVPLISTMAFAGAELWCPYCGENFGIMDTDEFVESTPELEDRQQKYKAATKSYLRANATFSCSAMMIDGVRVSREDIPKDYLNEQSKIIEGFEFGIRVEDFEFTKLTSDMNREIKFRAWNIELEKYFYSHYPIDENDDSRDWFPFVFSVGIKGLHENKMILQQFTGLKDKNGKDIYEGDIINVKGWYFVDNDRVDKTHIDYNGSVIYKDDCGCFAIKHPQGTETPLFFDMIELHDKSFEVVGNICETPELLKALQNQ